MMVIEEPGAALADLRQRIGGTATALISRDGTVLCAEMPNEGYLEAFGVMCATVFGAAVTANAELGRGLPNRVVVEGGDSMMIVLPSGSKKLLVAVLAGSADVGSSLAEVAAFADLLREY